MLSCAMMSCARLCYGTDICCLLSTLEQDVIRKQARSKVIIVMIHICGLCNVSVLCIVYCVLRDVLN
jgi:hypothetical protein